MRGSRTHQTAQQGLLCPLRIAPPPLINRSVTSRVCFRSCQRERLARESTQAKRLRSSIRIAQLVRLRANQTMGRHTARGRCSYDLWEDLLALGAQFYRDLTCERQEPGLIPALLVIQLIPVLRYKTLSFSHHKCTNISRLEAFPPHITSQRPRLVRNSIPSVARDPSPDADPRNKERRSWSGCQPCCW